jgi:hypothetical protein
MYPTWVMHHGCNTDTIKNTTWSRPDTIKNKSWSRSQSWRGHDRTHHGYLFSFKQRRDLSNKNYLHETLGVAKLLSMIISGCQTFFYYHYHYKNIRLLLFWRRSIRSSVCGGFGFITEIFYTLSVFLTILLGRNCQLNLRCEIFMSDLSYVL